MWDASPLNQNTWACNWVPINKRLESHGLYSVLVLQHFNSYFWLFWVVINFLNGRKIISGNQQHNKWWLCMFYALTFLKGKKKPKLLLWPNFFSALTWETSESTVYITPKFWQKTEKFNKYSKYFLIQNLKNLEKSHPATNSSSLFSLGI